MEAVSTDTLRAVADSLVAETKSLERKARSVKQQAAALRDYTDQLQAKEAKSDYIRSGRQ
jgi:hypothetical protein